MKSRLLLIALTAGQLLAQCPTKIPAVQPYGPPAPTPASPGPWLTGPLIAPVGAVVPYGDFEIENYVFATTDIGAYNAHWKSESATSNFFSLNPQWLLYFGLTPWMDVNIVPQFFYNYTDGQHATRFGDFNVAFDFQLLDPAATPCFPGIKFTIRETFPTGPYDNLNPDKLLTDQTGAGTFGTTFNLVLYKVYSFGKAHYLSTTYSAAYTVTTPVNVQSFNLYGGGYGTNGVVLPGQAFTGIVSFEYSLTQNWALALDNVYSHVDSSTFTGDLGTLAPHSTLAASVGLPSSEQISFAPAIEYNWSANMGLIVGAWITGWGRNSEVFRSGVANFYWTY